jgi:predicted phage terminase large subunit-like protein
LTVSIPFDPSLLHSLEARLAAEWQKREEKKSHHKLINFVRYFWDVLEPVEPFVDGWVLQGLCDHLEAVTHGDIKRLLANVPPGFMKSLLTDVFWPAWEWSAMDMPHLRYVAFSYAAHLTERDNNKFLMLLQSKKFQDMYGDKFGLVEQGKVKVSNDKTGSKFASSVDGVGTGERGNRVILDDAHNIREAESQAVRSSTVQWVREAMSNRLNNMARDSIVAIMQRSHEDDASNTLIDLDYVHYNVPMEYDPARHCTTVIGWSDPRTEEGELAWEERFPLAVTNNIRRTIGPYAYAGQYQQAPEVRGGSIIKRDYWQHYVTDDGRVPSCSYVIASLDPAYTAKQENDPSGFVILGVYQNENQQSRIICLNAWRKRLELHGQHIERLPNETQAEYTKRTMPSWGLCEWLVYSCKRFKVDKLLIEAKASGHSVAQEMRRLHGNELWGVQLCDPKGADKVARVHAIQHLFADGMISIPAYSDGTLREWGQMIVDEMAAFPKGANDDLTDAMSQGLKHLRDAGLAVRRDEAAAAIEEMRRHRGTPPAPLYGV